ncbi:OmpA family protein [Bradymonas sediminis]|uniref:Uncharacterized protein n=1 Tax=Bradymonas sediminis TaxID=1548548 RepID=A0A2Z4FKB4_9DELT|nr:OmpA family protein [Bradymonas sediminis]AWV89118.1 hypothetical protein DN745_07125 [Bradymonas sediminis]TDP64416.1 outer membrane protein OmpA-like peptidoglycan-associated protein [Bradymonas sediminis]
MNRSNSVIFVGCCAALALTLSACASTPPKHLQEARSTYNQAANHSHAAQYAPTELQQAKQSLARAEKAYQDSADSNTTHTMAYLALRRAQQAMASAELNYMATTRKARENELLARTDAARMHYQRRLAVQKQSAAATRQLNEQQLQEQRRQLQDALDKLDEQQMTQADMQSLQTQYQDAMAQLDAEIERREAAEAQLEEVTQKLANVAEVRQDAGGATIISLDSATLFENGKYDLLPIARQNLQRVAEALKMQPEVTLTVAGFTSSTGSEEFNQTLSQNRAESVKDYLVSRGIPGERIDTVGYGQDRPIASNETPEGRAMNRRVEIILDNAEAIGGGPEDAQEQELPEDDYLDNTGDRLNSPLPPVDQIIPSDEPGPGDAANPAAPGEDYLAPEQSADDEEMQPEGEEGDYIEGQDDWPGIIQDGPMP